MSCARRILPWLLLASACSGTPVEATGASSNADDDDADDDDDDATSNPTDASITTTDPSGDPTTDPTADTTSASDPDATSNPTTDGGEEATTTTAGESSSTGDTGPDGCHVVLDEIAFDVMGNDDELEWIALHNPCPQPIFLDDIALGWGGVDYTWGTLQLEGMIASDECLVIGGPQASNTNYNPVWGLDVDLEADLQNGDGAADAIGLFVGNAADIDADSVPFDAVLYGLANDNAVLDETGLPGAVDVAPGTDAHTIARLPGTDTWVVNETPSPNACNDPSK